MDKETLYEKVIKEKNEEIDRLNNCLLEIESSENKDERYVLIFYFSTQT